MAAHGITAVGVPVERGVIARERCCSRSERVLLEMEGGLRAPVGRKNSSSARLVSAVRGGRREGRVVARQGLGSKQDVGLLYSNIASATLHELETFQSRRWSDAAEVVDDGGSAAWEAFANGGGITERGLERLVDSLLTEEGQSAEDYQRREKYFNLIAEFFRQGKAYSAEKTELSSAATTVQSLVDSILANDGRSAADYNVRAQFFAKSAEVFPFNAEVGRL